MLSTVCFNLDQSKTLSSGNGLNVFQVTSLPLNGKKKNPKILGNGKNVACQHFFLSLQCFQKPFPSDC